MTAGETLRVRSMVAADVDAILSLERGSEQAPHWRREDYLGCAQTQAGSALQRITFVAEWNVSFAGFAVVRYLAVSSGNEAELESIIVLPEVRRHGIGSRLLAAVIDAAKRLGARRLDLEVRASNAAAVRLYRSAGFMKSGRRRAYYHNPEEDAVLMSLML